MEIDNKLISTALLFALLSFSTVGECYQTTSNLSHGGGGSDYALFNKCAESPSASQSELNECSYKQFKKYDSELNLKYNKLLMIASNTPGAVDKIKKQERGWVKFRDYYIEAMFPKNDKLANYGSRYLMDKNLALASLTLIHIRDLNYLINAYNSN